MQREVIRAIVLYDAIGTPIVEDPMRISALRATDRNQNK